MTGPALVYCRGYGRRTRTCPNMVLNRWRRCKVCGRVKAAAEARQKEQRALKRKRRATERAARGIV